MQFPANLEADYQSDLGPEKIRVLRLTTALGAALYASFGILDFWAMPSTYHEVWAIRAVVIALTFSALAVATWRPQFILPRYSLLVGMIHVMWGAGIVGMIFLARRGDLAWSSYYCGLMLVCSALPVGYLTLRPTCSLGLVCVVGYILLAVWGQGMLTPQYWPLLLTNCYFLVAATIVGIVLVSIRERYSREVYLLRQALCRDTETVKEAKRQSDFLAEHDTLTEMPNRIFFMRRLGELIERAKQADTIVAVLFLDLDGFKPVNDYHGHQIGDMVLRVVGQRLRSCVRAVDLVARWGGDEFVVGVELDQQHISFVDRLRQNLSKAIAGLIGLDGCELSVTASIGTAMHPFDAGNAAGLIDVADKRMYEIKRKSAAKASSSPPTAVVPVSSDFFAATDSLPDLMP